MKRTLSAKSEIRNFWLVEAISDEVESIERNEAIAKRERALSQMRYSFDYDYRHYFDPYGLVPKSHFGAELFRFVLAEWRAIGKTW